jgi:hypothetical protein
MSSRNSIIQLFYFVLYIGLQIIFVQNMVLFDVAFCFLYIGFLLLIPFETGPLLLLLVGAATGVVVDIFYDSLGIHMAASVLIMYLRPHWIKLITPRGGYEIGMEPTLKLMKFEWFATYSLPLIFVHHLALFYIEAGGFGMFFFTLIKVLSSTLFTFATLVIIQYLFYSSRRSI